jgi:SOS response regulatory protein OraA/RecX
LNVEDHEIAMPRSRPSAWDAALKLLAGRDYALPEMQAKLAQRGYDQDEVQAALGKLARYGYVVATANDQARLEAMAAEYLRKKKNPHSAGALRALEAFLLRKGFDEELVAAHLAARAGPHLRDDARDEVPPSDL